MAAKHNYDPRTAYEAAPVVRFLLQAAVSGQSPRGLVHAVCDAVDTHGGVLQCAHVKRPVIARMGSLGTTIMTTERVNKMLQDMAADTGFKEPTRLASYSIRKGAARNLTLLPREYFDSCGLAAQEISIYLCHSLTT